MASGFLGASFWASFLERAVGLLRLGRAQGSTWWWQLGSLGHNATLRPQLIQEHRQSQGNQCICQRSINAGCNCGTQLPEGRFLAFITRWPENACILSPENQVSAEKQELHHPAGNFFIPVAVGLLFGFWLVFNFFNWNWQKYHHISILEQICLGSILWKKRGRSREEKNSEEKRK